MEELPYVAGMLDGIGVDSLAECNQIVQAAEASANASCYSTDTLTAYQTADFLSTVDECIGNSTELNFSVVLNVSADGTVNEVLGKYNTYGEGATFPLSEYFPHTSDEMYQSGFEYAGRIRETADEISLDIQNTLSTMANETRSLQLYHRVDARNYANRYTSNATNLCPHGKVKMDSSKYNPNYTWYCHNDCANYVSQAIAYGGLSQSSTWKPGEYAWNTVYGLLNYFYPSLAKATNYTDCAAGGLIVTYSAGGETEHVVMCVQNDTVNRAYSGHTGDELKQPYTSSYPNYGTRYARYFYFPFSTTESQYDSGTT